MFYKFPTIEHIDQVLPAIAGREEFVISQKDGYKAIDYVVNFADTFPDWLTYQTDEERLIGALRRECRGIKFYDDGRIAGRPYHKFHNLNERPESHQDRMPWHESYTIMNKMDGSMIHPIMLNDNVIYCSKMGYTEVAVYPHEFAHARPGYIALSRDLMKNKLTPIFEWCSRKNRIVIDHPEDRLILTGIRHMHTGDYHPYPVIKALANSYDVEVGEVWSEEYGNISDFLKLAVERKGEEGFIFRFADGHMAKIKNSWYCEIHSTKEALAFEKNVISLILGNLLDDIMPRFLEDDRNRVLAFNQALSDGIRQNADRLNAIVADLVVNNTSKKDFALNMSKNFNGMDRALIYRIWDGKDAFKEIVSTILKNASSSTKIDEVRYLFGGIRWENF